MIAPDCYHGCNQNTSPIYIKVCPVCFWGTFSHAAAADGLTVWGCAVISLDFISLLLPSERHPIMHNQRSLLWQNLTIPSNKSEGKLLVSMRQWLQHDCKMTEAKTERKTKQAMSGSQTLLTPVSEFSLFSLLFSAMVSNTRNEQNKSLWVLSSYDGNLPFKTL